MFIYFLTSMDMDCLEEFNDDTLFMFTGITSANTF